MDQVKEKKTDKK